MATHSPKGDGRFPTREWTLVARLKNDVRRSVTDAPNAQSHRVGKITRDE